MKKYILGLSFLGLGCGNSVVAEDINPERSILTLNAWYAQYGEQVVSDAVLYFPSESYRENFQIGGDWALDGILKSSYEDFSEGNMFVFGTVTADENKNAEVSFEGRFSAEKKSGEKTMSGLTEGVYKTLNDADFLQVKVLNYLEKEKFYQLNDALKHHWIKTETDDQWPIGDLITEQDKENFRFLSKIDMEALLEEVVFAPQMFGASKPIQTINSPYGVEVHVPLEITNEKIQSLGVNLGTMLENAGASESLLNELDKEIKEGNARVQGSFIFTETKNPFLDLVLLTGTQNIQGRLKVEFMEDGLGLEFVNLIDGKSLLVVVKEGALNASVDNEWELEITKTETDFDASLKTDMGYGFKEMAGMYLEKGTKDSWSGVIVFPHFLTGTSSLAIEIKEFVLTPIQSKLRVSMPIDGLANLNINIESNRSLADISPIERPSEFLEFSKIENWWK